MIASERASALRYFVQGALIVVGAALFTYGLHTYGVLDRWENDNLDRFLRLNDPKQSDAIVLVTIDDKDYDELFNGRSPLDQTRVTQLLLEIVRAEPRVIGVDLDTSHWAPDGQTDLDTIKVPIVWARDAWKEDSTQRIGENSTDRSGTQYSLNRIGKVRGRENVTGLCTAVPAMQVDADGIVRRAFAVSKIGATTLPSFPAMVADAYNGSTRCEPRVSAESGHHDEPINFLSLGYGFRRFTANAVLALAKSDTWTKDPDFHQRVVLLGGTYRAARDKYVTPIGLMDGVELIAHVTQNEISRNPVHVPSHWAHFFAEVAVGLTLLTVLFFLPRGWKLVVLFATILIAITTSFLLFRTSAYFFSFIPVLAGLRIHEAIEQFLERRHLKQEIASLRRKLDAAHAPEPVEGPPSAKSEPANAGEMQEIPPT